MLPKQGGLLGALLRRFGTEECGQRLHESIGGKSQVKSYTCRSEVRGHMRV